MVYILLEGEVEVNTDYVRTWKEINSEVHHVTRGGRCAPKECEARTRVAIIVPFRDREAHLKVFLAHMHPILQRQLIEYQIFVIEQVTIKILNTDKYILLG